MYQVNKIHRFYDVINFVLSGVVKLTGITWYITLLLSFKTILKQKAHTPRMRKISDSKSEKLKLIKKMTVILILNKIEIKFIKNQPPSD